MKRLQDIKNWEEMKNQVIWGDCLEGMKLIPDKSIDLILTDPPYGIGEAKIQNHDLDSKYGKRHGVRHKSFNWDDQIPHEEYFQEIFRISKNQVICGGNYFAEYLKNSRCWIVWDKMNDEFYSTSDGELIWTSFDGRLRFFRRSHGLDKGFMTRKEGFGNVHPTQKPVELMRWILENYSKPTDVICDPFMGSWTTARACKDLGRNFIGFELEEDYCKIGEERLRQENLF